jgi:hypothetical protein
MRWYLWCKERDSSTENLYSIFQSCHFLVYWCIVNKLLNKASSLFRYQEHYILFLRCTYQGMEPYTRNFRALSRRKITIGKKNHMTPICSVLFFFFRFCLIQNTIISGVRSRIVLNVQLDLTCLQEVEK